MRTQQEKKNMQYVMQIRTVLVTFAVAFCVGILLPSHSNSYKIATWLWVPIFVFMFAIYNPLYARNYKVYIKNNMIFVEYGVLILNKKAVSIPNIQYVKQSQGLIQKSFYQYSVVVYTAGGTVYVTGLSLDNALKLQRKLTLEKGVENLE